MNRELNLTPDQEAAVGCYLAGEMSADERAGFEIEAARNEDLAEALYRQREITGFLAPQPAVVQMPRLRSRARWTVAGLLATAAMASFFLFMRPNTNEPGPAPVFRGEQSALPTPVTGEGRLAAWPETLAWRAVPEAIRYRVHLRDDQAVTLLITTTVDTMLTLNREQMPRELPSGGHWQVTPILPGDHEGPAGPLVRFEVRN